MGALFAAGFCDTALHPDVLCGGAQHSEASADIAGTTFSYPLISDLPKPGTSVYCHFNTHVSLSIYAEAKGNFWLSAWWFGLLRLIRGFGFGGYTPCSSPQAAIASVLLQAYVVAQTALQPWKARLMNVMDLLLSTALLLLIRTSRQEDQEKEEQFGEAFTFCILFLLFFGLAFMLLASLTAMGLQRRGYDASLVLNMGKGMIAEQETEALKGFAKALLEVAADELQLGIEGLNPYDLKQLSKAIEILDDVLATNGYA